jgi:hypothetical protein
MITDWINLTRVTIEGAERLYPNGLDWNLAAGINAVVGGTGLGKTTLVYAMQFAVFGKLVIDSAERIEREFFKDRLTDRSGQKLAKFPPLVRVEFAVGPARLSVRRICSAEQSSRQIATASRLRQRNTKVCWPKRLASKMTLPALRGCRATCFSLVKADTCWRGKIGYNMS